MRLDVFTSNRHITGCRVATPGVMVMLAWVVRRGADQTPVCANVCRDWPEIPLRYAESFPLGADAGLLRDQLPIPLRVLAGLQGSWRLLGLASTHSWRSNFVFQAAAF